MTVIWWAPRIQDNTITGDGNFYLCEIIIKYINNKHYSIHNLVRSLLHSVIHRHSSLERDKIIHSKRNPHRTPFRRHAGHGSHAVLMLHDIKTFNISWYPALFTNSWVNEITQIKLVNNVCMLDHLIYKNSVFARRFLLVLAITCHFCTTNEIEIVPN